MSVGAGEPLVPAEEVLRGCEHVLLFFSAAWCERGELERLRQWYSAQRTRASPPRFEVVYISGDRTEAEFRDYYAGMPWPAVPWGHECCPRLNVSCGVAEVPRLVVVHGASGYVVTAEGRLKTHESPGGLPWGDAAKALANPAAVKRFAQGQGGMAEMEGDLSKGTRDWLWSIARYCCLMVVCYYGGAALTVLWEWYSTGKLPPPFG